MFLNLSILQGVTSTKLGSHAIENAVRKAGINKSAIEEVGTTF